MYLVIFCLFGGNTLLYGEGFSDFYRYKVRAFRPKIATKIGLFIDRLLTIIFNPYCRHTGGGFTKNAKFRFQNYFSTLILKYSSSTFRVRLVQVGLSQTFPKTPPPTAKTNLRESSLRG